MSGNANGSAPVRQSVVPHMVVKGAADAIDFYVKAFGAHELFRMPTPDGRLLHATLAVGNSQFHLCDEFPENSCSQSPITLGGTSVTLHLNVDDVDATYAKAVTAGAVGVMPPADMFWGDRYGQVVDPFGHRWSLSAPTAQDSSDVTTSCEVAAEPQLV